ncbi:hypothetical protein [Actinacidiphila guanduensis]|uniref:Uncharacterized protein n=1 Tax=Actinacidiphila guanduensis TaxID=310781 RepID=A0A1H0JD88_9ACTN|nr:hypothetical protein [Actinacidiphila guanduensis]SDO41594.1 hypothetical protein SAMN05216259_109335 [Actinacidiphila guanduensis]
MSDKGRRDGTRPGPRARPGLPGGRLPSRGGHWLTGQAAELLLTGGRVQLADAEAAEAVTRLARLLAAAGGQQELPGAGPQPAGRGLDPAREEAALAAFRAARSAAHAAEVGAAAVPAGPSGAAAAAAAASDGRRRTAWLLAGVRAPLHALSALFSAPRPLARTARTREQPVERRPLRTVLAATASVVALSGIAVAVALTTGRIGVPGHGSHPAPPAATRPPAADTPGGGAAGPGAGAPDPTTAAPPAAHPPAAGPSLHGYGTWCLPYAAPFGHAGCGKDTKRFGAGWGAPWYGPHGQDHGKGHEDGKGPSTGHKGGSGSSNGSGEDSKGTQDAQGDQGDQGDQGTKQGNAYGKANGKNGTAKGNGAGTGGTNGTKSSKGTGNSASKGNSGQDGKQDKGKDKGNGAGKKSTRAAVK